MSTSLHRLCRTRGALVSLLAFVLIAALSADPMPAGAQGDLTLQVEPAFAGNYAPDSWLPLSIVLRNGGPPASVTVAAGLPLAPARNTAVVELPAGGEVALTLYAAMDRSARELIVTASAPSGQPVEQRVAVRPREGERMLGLVSAQPLELDLPRREDLLALPFLPFELAPAVLPDQPAGLASLSLLLVGSIPADTLSPAQLATLHAWVRAGGHLVLGGGPDAATTAATLPAELRPAEPAAPASLDPALLGSFVEAAAPTVLEGVQLSPAPDAVVFGPAERPLWATRAVGAGQVTQLGFDPGAPALRGWPAAPILWDRLLVPAGRYGALGTDFSPDPNQARILSGTLANLPPLNLPNATPLFALLVVYTIVIGPGLALLLRRFDRQALGWLVLPAIALGFTAIATGIAIAGRADQRLANQVTLVEQVDASTARARTAFGILTPLNEPQTVGVEAEGVARPLVGGTASFGAISGAAGDLGQEGAELGLELKAWELQGAQLEALVPLPALDAELRVGAEGILATVRNTTGQPLRDVVVVYAGNVARLGDLGPEESASVRWPPTTPPGQERPEYTAPLSAIVLGERLQAGRTPGTALERQVLIEEGLLSAVGSAGPQGEGLEPLVLAWMPAGALPLTFSTPDLGAQEEALLVGRPRIVGAGPAQIPAGWMQLRRYGEQRTICASALGRGLAASPAPVTMTLALPADMAAFQARSAVIDLQSERTWPNAGVTTELYDWQAQTWVPLSFDGPGTLALSDAAPYVRGGRLSLRLGGRIEEAGCVFADVSLQGELPAPGGRP